MMHTLLERLWQEEECTAVLVTHDVSEAVALADRIILLDERSIALDLPIEIPPPVRSHGGAICGAAAGGIEKDYGGLIFLWNVFMMVERNTGNVGAPLSGRSL